MMEYRIGIIGLGYVGLPLAVAFSEHFSIIGFDTDLERVKELKSAHDKTNQIGKEKLEEVINTQKILFTSSPADLDQANVYIITVPTPVDDSNTPDLSFLQDASQLIGKKLKKQDLIIYESTVYPGCTEEFCIPILEKESGMKCNLDFQVGYSPERINPGDQINTIDKIVKITSGSSPEAALLVDSLYKNIIKAGTHQAPSIKVAEAAKVVENAQRDINISFMNELALIFDRMEIDTHDVLKAAGTKFNFLHFKPGLVGGHCISVDPYYLSFKAIQLGYHPEVILSGRRVNDRMAAFIASKIIKLMTQKDIVIKGSRALILGFTYKENNPDIRKTGVAVLYDELNSYGLNVDIYDPIADLKEVKNTCDIGLLTDLQTSHKYDVIILAVAHDKFLDIDITRLKKEKSVVFDTKGVWDRLMVDGRL